MEMRVEPYVSPEPIVFNFDELKTQIMTKISDYKTLQYTSDQIQAARADRAALNSLKKALNDERIRREKEFLEPFNQFKSQIRELCDLIDEPVQLIDKQIKECEEREKAEKRDKCIELFGNTKHPEWLRYEQIESTRWYNKTTSLKSIEEDIKGIIETINKDIELISNLPDYSFEAMEEYKRSLDASRALAEGKRLADIQRRKEEEARRREEEDRRRKEETERLAKEVEERTKTPEIPFVDAEVVEITADETKGVEKAVWLKFEALLTVSQAAELKSFFRFNRIDFKPIQEV